MAHYYGRDTIDDLLNGVRSPPRKHQSPTERYMRSPLSELINDARAIGETREADKATRIDSCRVDVDHAMLLTGYHVAAAKGEGHGNRRAASRYDYSRRMMRWMDHYLKGPGGAPPPVRIDYGLDVDE